MKTRRAGVLGVALLVAAVSSGCGGEAPERPTPTGPESFAYYTNYTEGGDGAGLDGTLEEVDGCLVADRGGQSVIPAFPFGQASWDGEELTLASFGPDGERDGQVVAPGEEIHLGGGFRDNMDGLDGVTPPGCPEGAEYFLVFAYPRSLVSSR